MKLQPALAGFVLALPAVAVAETDLAGPFEPEDRILVTADFRSAGLDELSVSATVIDADTLAQRDAAHLEDVLNLAPNVNLSSGASRGRFFQIRGIGERSQFVEPMNASVGLLIDSIDLTGIGGAATTLDIQQVEILRGPQGTLFGANALAGMINLVSGAPTAVFSGRFEASIAEFGTRAAEGMVSGPLSDTLGFRVAYANYQSDGFQHNAFLGVSDTDNLDEQTLRAKLRWQPGDDLTVDLSTLYLDLDNGFDGFSLDNNRTTFSDQPGHDRQETLAASARIEWRGFDAFTVEGLISHTDADMEYGFDEDWSFAGFCEAFECLAPSFESFDNYIRDNTNTTLDIRLISNTDADTLGWVVGAYARDQSQDLRRQWTFFEQDFLRDYDTDNRAVYGQLDVPLGRAWKLVAGARVEQREARYADSDGAAFDPDETLWGGKLALEYQVPGGGLAYALAARGYKAGGVNSDSAIPDAQREFDTETLWNYELGLKRRFFDDRLDLRAALFFQDRDDVQTAQSLVRPIEGEDCPCQFIDFTTNATAGQSYGLEAELNWQPVQSVGVFASLGLLESRFEDFLNFSHVDADPVNGVPVDMDGRDLPHAPNWMFALGGVWQLSERVYLRGELEGKDAFFFSSRHEVRSDAYRRVNLRLGYRHGRWDLALWARNLTDQDIEVRAFGAFGNDPRKGYIVEPYFQFGEPRVLGATAAYAF
ncbi:MAG: TonB-dependent receptor [Wenzhouxiangellaceae bacterium]|nr:TonB-dependent receptor [Wenzhouxiangellaceae bacterium]